LALDEPKVYQSVDEVRAVFERKAEACVRGFELSFGQRLRAGVVQLQGPLRKWRCSRAGGEHGQ
jgi:hypothetical protein